MKNMLVFGSIIAASAATFACGDSTGDGGSGGATTQGSTSPATGSGSGSTKAASTTGTGASTAASTANSTAASTGSGSGQTTAASSGSGGMCAPTGDACQDCVFMNCCNEYTACAADNACQTCMDCLQTEGTTCLINGMCNLQDPNQGAFIQCAQQCQAQCT